jgi:hypothetical protein
MLKEHFIAFQILVVTVLIWVNSGTFSCANTNELSAKDISMKPFYSVYSKKKWTEGMGLVHSLIMKERAIAQEQIKRINIESECVPHPNVLEDVTIKLNKLYQERDQIALEVIDYWKEHPEDVRKENIDLYRKLPKEEQALRERISYPQRYSIDTYKPFADKAYTVFIREPSDCLKYIRSENVKDRLDIITVISNLTDPEYITLILTMTNDPNDEVKDAATKILDNR